MAQATSNLAQHMVAHHKSFPAYVEHMKKEALKTVANTQPRDKGIMGFIKREDESALHQRLILGFIVDGHKSISVVEEEGYKTMMRGFTKRPSLQIPCRRTMHKLLTHTAVVAREKLKALSAGQEVSLTCDGWTSGNGLAMLGVTGHWINKDWKLVCACFDVSELAGSHDGIRLAAALKAVMASYDILETNVTAVTTDTAANQKNAIMQQTNMEWLPCICHVLELVMGVLMTRFKELLAKLHRIQAYVRRSTAAKARFAEAQRFCELTPGALPGACPTRWWSTTTSVQAFVKNERAVKMLCDWAIVSAKKDNIPILTEHDWIALADILHIAVPWMDFQRRLEGEKYVTISTLDIIVDEGFSIVSNASSDFNLAKPVRDTAGLMETDMYKRFHPGDAIRVDRAPINTNNPLRIPRMASVLDPRTKSLAWAYTEDIESDFYGPIVIELDAMIQLEEKEALAVASTAEDDASPPPPEKVNRVGASAAQTEGGSMTRHRDGFSLSSLIQKAAARKRLENADEMASPAADVQKAPVSPRVVIMNEWEAYKGAEVMEETVQRLGGPLGWWRQNEMLYPHIARLARKYLAVQASSAASERLFSQAGLVVTAKRNRMTGDTAADIIFLHESLKHKLW